MLSKFRQTAFAGLAFGIVPLRPPIFRNTSSTSSNKTEDAKQHNPFSEHLEKLEKEHMNLFSDEFDKLLESSSNGARASTQGYAQKKADLFEKLKAIDEATYGTKWFGTARKPAF